MSAPDLTAVMQRLVDERDIRTSLHLYARGVDRGDWDLVRSTYHSDATDDHVDFRGGVDELIEWLAERFAEVDNSVHFLGSCLVEFIDDDLALVETYFVSSRVIAPDPSGEAQLPATDGVCRQSWGRYIDRFERRTGEWRVAKRAVIVDSRFRLAAAGGIRTPGHFWGLRDGTDQLWAEKQELSSPAR